MRLKELAEKRLKELYQSETASLSVAYPSPVPPTHTQGVEQVEQWNKGLATRRSHVGTSLGPAEPPSTLSEEELAAMPLRQFARSALQCVVRSKVLGEAVVFAADNALVDPSEQRPVYRAAELIALAGLAKLSPEDLRQIHRVKCTFHGTILA